MYREAWASAIRGDRIRKTKLQTIAWTSKWASD